MFSNGLHNIVDIYFMNRNSTSRIEKHSMYVSDYPDLEKVPCRIIKDCKIIFDKEIKLLAGYVIKEVNTNMTYKVVKRKRVFGLNEVHHSSYEIEIKAESDKIAK